MKVIKHSHACLELIEGNQRVVIDPGFYSEPMDDLADVQALVITHMHDDHCFEAQVERILKSSPQVQILGTDEVVARLAKANITATAVHHGDWHKIGNFELEFFGDLHAEIHHTIPILQNCGVMVNDLLYYPGDSFTTPDRKVELLACPSSAPWLKISEVMDFVDEVKAAKVIPTHNIHLSPQGHELNNSRIKQVAEENGASFEFLQPGESIEI